ncbi:MAG: iron ABC transporter permease [Dehalococcoidia bacterium]|nr:iron ABC transporter permease [Dehalococcoidia bacterium]
MKRSTILMLVLLAVVGFLVVYPLVMIFYGSFRGGPPYFPDLKFSLQGYIDAFGNTRNYFTLFTSFWLGAVRALLAIIIAVFLAWVVTRTDTPYKKILEVAIWIQFFLPYQPIIMAWILLLSPRTGMLNQWLVQTFHLPSAPFDIYTYGGIIWVSTIQWASVMFILLTPAFKGMDAALEESSRILGASRFATLRRITLPILAPTIMATMTISFVKIMESFETELFLGYSKGIRVYTTRVYNLIYESPPNYPEGMALSTVFLFIIFGLIYLNQRLLGNRQYVTISGRGYATRPTPLGRWKYVTLAAVIFYFIVGVVIPLAGLTIGTFMQLFGVAVEDPWTTRHWVGVFTDPYFYSSLKNSLYIGLGSATVGMVFYALISYVITKTKFAGRRALDFMTWLPWGVPGMVISLGFLWAYVGGIRLPFTLYGTLYLIMLVLIVQAFPLGIRTMNGSMMQLGNELEESSRTLGASWLYTFRRIVAPLITPAFISTWIIIFVLALKSLGTVLFLTSTKTRPLSVLMFEYWMGGSFAERALVVGLIQALLVLALAIVARVLGAKHGVARG